MEFFAFEDFLQFMIWLLMSFVDATFFLLIQLVSALDPATMTFPTTSKDLIATLVAASFYGSVVFLCLYYVWFGFKTLFGSVQRLIEDESTIIFPGTWSKSTFKKRPAVPKPVKKLYKSSDLKAMFATLLTDEIFTKIIQNAVHKAMPTALPTLPEGTFSSLPDVSSLVKAAIQTTLNPILSHIASLADSNLVLQNKLTTLESQQRSLIQQAVQETLASIPTGSAEHSEVNQAILEKLAAIEQKQATAIQDGLRIATVPMIELEETNNALLARIAQLEESQNASLWKLSQLVDQQKTIDTLTHTLETLPGLFESKLNEVNIAATQHADQRAKAEERLIHSVNDLTTSNETKFAGINETLEKLNHTVIKESSGQARTLMMQSRKDEERYTASKNAMNALRQDMDKIMTHQKTHDDDLDDVKQAIDVRSASLDAAMANTFKVAQSANSQAAATSMGMTQIVRKSDSITTAIESVTKGMDEIRVTLSGQDAILETIGTSLSDKVEPIQVKIQMAMTQLGRLIIATRSPESNFDPSKPISAQAPPTLAAAQPIAPPASARPIAKPRSPTKPASSPLAKNVSNASSSAPADPAPAASTSSSTTARNPPAQPATLTAPTPASTNTSPAAAPNPPQSATSSTAPAPTPSAPKPASTSTSSSDLAQQQSFRPAAPAPAPKLQPLTGPNPFAPVPDDSLPPRDPSPARTFPAAARPTQAAPPITPAKPVNPNENGGFSFSGFGTASTAFSKSASAVGGGGLDVVPPAGKIFGSLGIQPAASGAAAENAAAMVEKKVGEEEEEEEKKKEEEEGDGDDSSSEYSVDSSGGRKW